MIEIDIKIIYGRAAAMLGWTWCDEVEGWIHEEVRVPGSERGYWVAVSCEDACVMSGLESEDEVRRYVREER